MKRNIVHGLFVSLWDGRSTSIETHCEVDMASGEVVNIEMASEEDSHDVTTLDEEYVVIDGKKYPVGMRDGTYYLKVTEVKTNMGTMPIEDYREMVASQYGYNSYEELYRSGVRLGHGYDCDPDQESKKTTFGQMIKQSLNEDSASVNLGNKLVENVMKEVNRNEREGH